MIDLSIFDSTSKIILSILGLLLALRKVVETFASHKRKEELKTDLDILEKLRNNNFETDEIVNKIERNIKNSYRDISHNFLSFFIGLTLFCGFGSWTLDLLNKQTNFNPWSIFTSLITAFGLSLILRSANNNDDTDDDENDDKLFMQININDKFGFLIGLSLFIVFGIMTFILVYNLKIFNYWIFLSGLFSIIGFVAFAQCIKRVK